MDVPVTANLNDILFPFDDMRGYAVGEQGAILRTLDGGVTWENLVYPNASSSWWFQSINAPVSFESCAVSGAWYLSHGKVLYTSNAGNIWSILAPNISYVASGYCIVLRSSFPINLTQGYTIYRQGRYSASSDRAYKTTNGGSSWSECFTPNFRMTNILFYNNNIGFIIGSESNIYRTTNAAASWAGPINFSGNQRRDLQGLCFINSAEWFIVGNNGTILKSTDQGTNWRVIPSGVESNLNDITFPGNGDIGIIVGEEGVILTSTNRGETWTVEYHPSRENLNAVSFPPGQTRIGYIAGSNGIILKNDGFLVNVECVNVSDTSPTMSVYPSQTSGRATVTISGLQASRASLRVFNSLGMRIAEYDMSDLRISDVHQRSISLHNAPSGLYLFVLSSDSHKLTAKIFVNH